MKDHFSWNLDQHFYTFVAQMKDHLSYKTTFCGPMGGLKSQVSLQSFSNIHMLFHLNGMETILPNDIVLSCQPCVRIAVSAGQCNQWKGRSGQISALSLHQLVYRGHDVSYLRCLSVFCLYHNYTPIILLCIQWGA